MKLPTIKVRLDKRFCLFDFLSRLSPFLPYPNERKLYSKRLRNLQYKFFYFLYNNVNKNYTFFIRYINKFNNSVFEEVWRDHKENLKKQFKAIKNIVKKEGTKYLKKILQITKYKEYPYNKIIVFVSFPRIEDIKPLTYGPTGYPRIYNKVCIIYVWLKTDRIYEKASDLYVLWHEIIHTLGVRQKELGDIDEAVAILYEDIVCTASKKNTKERLNKLLKEYSKQLRQKLVKRCLTWNWKKGKMSGSRFELYNKFKK